MYPRIIRSSMATVAVAAIMTVSGVLVAPLAAQAAPVAAAKTAVPYYLSLGDSYSVGYQPGKGATVGYTGYVAARLKMRLWNFGCGGATTTTILDTIGCVAPYGPVAATHPVAYPTTTQQQAALAFIAAHPGRVRLITVSIGGNDVTACAATANPVPCVTGVEATLKTNVTALVSSLRSALVANRDRSARIVGLTYPDVILGDYVYPAGKTDPSLANLSVTAFDALINPTLKTAYTSVPGGSFVNVTQAPYKLATAGDDTGGGPAKSATVTLAPYGKIPVAVWEVCQITYFCSEGNIHANNLGYAFIGQLVVKHYKSLPKTSAVS
jgi:lysophospholipase L1-like esterase